MADQQLQTIEAYEKILTANLQRAIDFVKFAETKNAALLALASAWVLAILNLLTGEKSVSHHFAFSLKVASVLALGAAFFALGSFFPRLHLPKFLGGKEPDLTRKIFSTLETYRHFR